MGNDSERYWCGYCGNQHAALCAGAKEGVRRVDELMKQIKAGQKKPGARELTNSEMRNRADRLRGYATTIKLRGGKVRPEYE